MPSLEITFAATFLTCVLIAVSQRSASENKLLREDHGSFSRPPAQGANEVSVGAAPIPAEMNGQSLQRDQPQSWTVPHAIEPQLAHSKCDDCANQLPVFERVFERASAFNGSVSEEKEPAAHDIMKQLRSIDAGVSELANYVDASYQGVLAAVKLTEKGINDNRRAIVDFLERRSDDIAASKTRLSKIEDMAASPASETKSIRPPRHARRRQPVSRQRGQLCAIIFAKEVAPNQGPSESAAPKKARKFSRTLDESGYSVLQGREKSRPRGGDGAAAWRRAR